MSASADPSHATRPSGHALPSRRSLLRTAAWAAPVATIAVAAPAIAASPSEPTDPVLEPQGSSGWQGTGNVDFRAQLLAMVITVRLGEDAEDIPVGSVRFTVHVSPDDVVSEYGAQDVGTAGYNWDVALDDDAHAVTFSNREVWPAGRWHTPTGNITVVVSPGSSGDPVTVPTLTIASDIVPLRTLYDPPDPGWTFRG
ncbi:hypothetical protein ACXET9_06360 [Brachybacterium sp. DNPG3]